ELFSATNARFPAATAATTPPPASAHRKGRVMPRRRARGAASSTSEGSGSSTDSAAPLPPPGIEICTGRPAGADALPWARQDDEDEKQRQPALFHKTKMCKFNQLGMCTRGEMCRFAHGKHDMNQLPDLSRTKLCKALAQGAAAVLLMLHSASLSPACLSPSPFSHLPRPSVVLPSCASSLGRGALPLLHADATPASLTVFYACDGPLQALQ
ncbi:unnamed protein product, partial [Prorocentrum cordatum]